MPINEINNQAKNNQYISKVIDNDEENCEEFFEDKYPKFKSKKEQECWVLFKKMSDKGLPVTFDTILKGMLTPTEYRLTKKWKCNLSANFIVKK